MLFTSVLWWLQLIIVLVVISSSLIVTIDRSCNCLGSHTTVLKIIAVEIKAFEFMSTVPLLLLFIIILSSYCYLFGQCSKLWVVKFFS